MMWDLKCLASAFCFAASNIFFTVYFDVRRRGQPRQSTNTSWRDLDPEYIEERFGQMREHQALTLPATLLGTLAWFFLIAPVVQSAWILSRGGRRMVGTHALLASLGVCGGILELLSRLMIVGMFNTEQWLAHSFNLDDWTEDGNDGTGWRVLEMIHIVTRGMVLWIDVFEKVAIAGIAFVLFHSHVTEPKFITINSPPPNESAVGIGDSKLENDCANDVAPVDTPQATPPPAAFSGVSTNQSSSPTSTTTRPTPRTFTLGFVSFGIAVGVLSVLDFIFAVLRFWNWSLFGRITNYLNIILGCILLPIWLLLLARQLPKATQRFEQTERRAAILYGGVSKENVGALD